MKNLLSIVLWILLVGGTAFASQKRVRDANPFHVFQAIKVTSNWSLSWDCFFQAQNWVVSDCQGNSFLTGAVGDFLPLYGNTITTPMSWDIYIDNNRALYWWDIYTFIQAEDITPEMNMVAWQWFGSYLKWWINLLHNQVNLFIKQWANILYGVSLWNTWALTYNDDYSTHFVDRSLIDKWYADNTYVPMSYTGNWNDAYSWIQSYSGRALLWNVIWWILSPIDNDIKFVVWSGATVSLWDIALWKNTKAYWINSSAIWRWGIYWDTIANWDSSLAMNWWQTIGTGSISIWWLANTDGLKALAVYGNAIWDYAMALWAWSDAVAYSTAIWFNVNTYDYLSSAFWYDLDCRWILCLGRYNLWLTGSVLEIWAWSATTWFNALTIHSSTSWYVAEFAWPIEINDWTNIPFRFAYSWQRMEWQYYTGGIWVSAVYSGWKFILP